MNWRKRKNTLFELKIPILENWHMRVADLWKILDKTVSNLVVLKTLISDAESWQFEYELIHFPLQVK